MRGRKTMKKLLTVLLVMLMAFALAACKNDSKKFAKSEGTMTYEQYAAAELESEVTIEGFVQAAQSYWNGASIYVQDDKGAYFLYNIAISEEDYAKLVSSTNYGPGWTGLANGAKIKVTGYKSEWSGEVEVIDAKSVTVDDSVKWIAEAKDLTAKLGTEELVNYQNQKVLFKGLKVEKAAQYNWDGSGAAGANSDLYFYLTDGNATYEFVVESYLCYEGSDVYNNVLNLKVGDTVDVEGFLYWYNGPDTHVTKVTVK